MALTFDQIDRVFALARDAEARALTPEQGLARLQAILAEPPRFGPATGIAGHMLMTVGIALCLQAHARDRRPRRGVRSRRRRAQGLRAQSRHAGDAAADGVRVRGRRARAHARQVRHRDQPAAPGHRGARDVPSGRHPRDRDDGPGVRRHRVRREPFRHRHRAPAVPRPRHDDRRVGRRPAAGAPAGRADAERSRRGRRGSAWSRSASGARCTTARRCARCRGCCWRSRSRWRRRSRATPRSAAT